MTYESPSAQIVRKAVNDMLAKGAEPIVEAPCCDAHFSSAYGTRMFSITQRTVNGVRFTYATWLPTNCTKRFATKREATAWVKAHERRCYGK